jgi:hypothetical protein
MIVAGPMSTMCVDIRTSIVQGTFSCKPYNPVSINVDREPRPTKRKRSSSSNNPIYKKHKRHLEQRSTRQHTQHAKLRQYSPKSYSPLNYSSRVTAVSSAKGRLPSPAPSTPQTIDTEIPSDCYNLGRLSNNILSTLTKVTFRPHSTRCCSFIVVVRDGRDERGVSFSQLAQLIESVGYVKKIDNFTIKPIEQHSFLLTGFSRHTSSRFPSGTILSLIVEGLLQESVWDPIAFLWSKLLKMRENGCSWEEIRVVFPH